MNPQIVHKDSVALCPSLETWVRPEVTFEAPAPVDKGNGIIYDTTMIIPRIVLDTNVLIAALRSRRGASHRLVLLIDSGKFETKISVPLLLEYEAVAKRLIGRITVSARDIDHILDYVCDVAKHTRVFYLWRPMLKDPKDDMILELAVAGRCDFIVTFNKGDFSGAEQFGIHVVTPKEFLKKIGAAEP